MKYIKYIIIISLFFIGYSVVQAIATDLQIDGGNTDTINENIPVGTVVGVLTSSGGTGPYTYSLACASAGADDTLFAVAGANLEVNSALDFEIPTDANADGTYEICIRSTDTGDANTTYDETITITINDLNSAPTDIQIDGGNTDTMDENTATNNIVGALTNTDDGEDNPETYTYSLTCALAGADDSHFNISGTNLRNTTVFDYESPVDFDTNNIYSVCVRVTETNGGLTYDETITITITDVFESTRSSGSMLIYTCKDTNATNYDAFGTHRISLCNYGITQTTAIFEGKLCSNNQQLTQNLKAPSMNGSYNDYTKGTVSEAKLLQAHMNRLGFNSGPEDGILGPISMGAILRMQASLGTIQDGYVGPLTRALLNNSC